MNIVGVGLLLYFLRRRVGGVDLVRVGGRDRAHHRGVACSSAPVSFGVWYALDRVLGRSTAAQIVSLGVALAIGAVVYFAVCRLLRVRELRVLRDTVTRRSI